MIEGYADSLGTEEFNLLLSYRRAKAVAALLMKAGVPSRQLLPRAYGEQMPLEGPGRESDTNRRVLFRADGLEECQEARSNESMR
jgi:outer membrane protein OmpA-like peptidoglycan-associated protein